MSNEYPPRPTQMCEPVYIGTSNIGKRVSTKKYKQSWYVFFGYYRFGRIKRIFGGVLCDDIMNDTLHEVKDEQPDQVTDQVDDQVAEPAKQPEEAKPQHALNPIEQAYESGRKIRIKGWHENSWIQKLSETESIDELKNTYDDTIWAFRTEPHKWELYTEPTEQVSSQAKLDNSFDKERFERMFCAVVASGRTESYEQDFLATNICLEKLDAYYASKNN